MSESFVTVKSISDICAAVKLHHIPFEKARYILHRALEVKTLEGYKFARPMLEIGIGYGLISSLFFESVIDYGVEIKQYSHNYYNMYKRVIYIDENNNFLPFGNDVMGSIYSMSVLEHVKNLDALLKECHRILKPGGGFVANVNTDKCKYKPMCFTKDFCPNLLTPDEWKQRFESVGFSVKKAIPALPPGIPWSLEIFSITRLVKIPLVNRIFLKNFWNQMYRDGFAFSNIDSDLTVTFICEKV